MFPGRQHLRRHRAFLPLPQGWEGVVLDIEAPPEPVPGVDPEVEKLLRVLSPRVREMVEAHYGLGGRPGQTVGEVAERYGVSRQWASQVIHRGLRRMREVAGR